MRKAIERARGFMDRLKRSRAVSIPMADKRQSRKVGFAEYRKQTRMPLPIKK